MTQAKRRKGYGAKLDDLDLLLAVAPERDVQVQTIPPEATRIDTGQSPEDFISEFGQTFSRAQFAGGEGLGFAHREDSAPNRFWDSEQVDVSLPDPGERHAASLLHEAGRVHASTETRQLLTSDGGSLWVADGTTIQRTDDPLSSSPTFVEDDPHAGESATAVRGLAVLGDEVYAGLGSNGIHKRDASGTWSHWSDLSAHNVWAVKRRIVAESSTTAEELHEARSGADSVLLATLSPGQTWRSVAGAGSHVLAGSDDGSIYAFSADEGANFSLENQTEIPFEEVRTLVELGGIVLIGTFVRVENGILGRLWNGVLTGDGSFTELSLIRQWGDEDNTIVQTPATITVGRDSGYVGMLEKGDVGVRPSLWHYDFVTGGVSRHLMGPDDSDNIHDVTSVGGTLFFSVRGDGLYRQSQSQYATSGYLITPAADFFTALDKSWLRIVLDADTPGDSSVSVSYATDLDAMDDPDSALWTQAGTVDSNSTDDEFDLTDARSRFVVLKVDLNATTDQTDTPQLFSVSVTANVIGEEVSVTLPVNVSDRHERFGRRPVRRKSGTGKTMFQNLLDKRGANVDLELYRHGLTVRGVVQEIQTPTQSITPRGSPTLYSLVTFRGTVTNKS